ncbi:MAG TPA: hypothetical protein VFN68_17005 [Acidimicrobiales bacterium]|nr:hypothetical protein [Acidimicrobiales bacterium]
MAENPYWVRLDREVVSVTGPEAGPYLQGQLSQDVAGLAAGSSAWSWLLAPNGKVDALLRVSALSGGDWLLDTDAGWGEAVLARLQRFKLRTRADLDLVAATVVGLRGAGWEALAAGCAPRATAVPPWPGLEGADLLFVDGGPPPLPAGSEMPAADYEAVRIRAGQPRMGPELGERTIPGETGLVPFTVSFTKGCYTGQELVARIDSRGGNVPRHLCRLRLDGEVPPGTDLLDGETVVGTVTSAADLAPSGTGAGWVGLGYVKRGFEGPRTLSAGRPGRAAQVEALPW